MLEQPLSIDLAKQTDVLQLLPCLPLLMNEARRSHLLIQYHRQPIWSMPENSTAQHVVVVHQETDSQVQVNRVMDGKKQKETLSHGSCIVIPADILHQSSWEQEVEFTLLLLEPTYLAQIAHETVDSDCVELIPQFAKLDSVISNIGFALKAELDGNGAKGHLYLESATTFLAAHLLRHYCTRTPSLPDYSGGLPKYKLREAIAYIHEHLSEEISLEAIASHLHMSQYYFCHLFKQSMGISPYQYVLRQRIDKAKQLLKQRHLAITDVALECGFANQTHFTKHFRKLMGTTPKAYREL
ncbi:helix-turn-helix transcriptional regulator [Oscillatoria sp. FACHB-1407]|uniref:helix-turn-helix transcriptional regulator n=1 Tax=Oscillatoria sp. FACHB-1407 TaxID=2692847 RepID=UPI0016843613|nr:AraC family transcriptional regulator [Oscillatoria sp. FACHB-1407]MBD2463080.1 helix-turn-helix transcriptional regulator [Oscillatoria sp. FACHB-1407]